MNFFGLPIFDNIYEHGYQSYPCLYDKNRIDIKTVSKINKSRNYFMDKLQESGVSTRPATHAVHMLKYYREKYNLVPEDFPNAYIANDCSISFPLFNGLSNIEQDFVISTVRNNL